MVCGMEAMHRVKGSFGDVLEVLDEENPAIGPVLAFILVDRASTECAGATRDAAMGGAEKAIHTYRFASGASFRLILRTKQAQKERECERRNK